MGETKITIGALEVDAVLFDFVATSLLPGSNRDEGDFWVNLESLLKEFSPRMEQLLRVRDDYQSQIDDWHIGRRGNPHDHETYLSFLTEIGYVQDRPTSVQVDTNNVDPEIASVPGPQLVVPVDNARYAINAANARWGSLYDALYGTDVISEDGGAENSGPYNPVRGAKVIAYARSLLDQHFPLDGPSHTASTGYKVVDSELRIITHDGDVSLVDPQQFVGFIGDSAKPDSIFLKKHGLHVEIVFNPSDPIGADDTADIADVMIESALSTIMDCEDSVATVDANDKVQAYGNWLGLMQGNLEVEFAKGGKSVVRKLESDSVISGPDGSEKTIRRRSLMLVRNVGMLLMTVMFTVDG